MCMLYLDSHCHLPEPGTDIFAHMKTSGVLGCVVNSVMMSDWTRIATIASTNKNIRGAIGIHPWYVEDAPQNWKYDLIAMLDDNPDLMIGEIGLDKTRDNFLTQEKVFISAIEIAIKYGRTINLHCVHAWERVLEILKTYRGELPRIIAHGFDGTQNAINCDADFYFSYSPKVANPLYKKMRESVLRVPKNKILIESDDTDVSRVILAADGVLNLRTDMSGDDILKNSIGVFFNGQIA